MANPISDTQLTPGTQIIIRGNVTYSHITRHIEGEELEKDKIRKRHKGQQPIEKPYTTITIANPRIEPKNPGQLSIDEQYLQNKIYMTTTTTPPTPQYTMQSKSPYLPSVAVRRTDNPNQYDQINPQGELDKGLDVSLVIRVFAAGNHNGLSLDAVIVNEPIRYYSFKQNYVTEMANRGIIINPLPADQIRQPNNNADMMPVEDEPAAQPTYAQVTSAPAGSAAFTATAANATAATAAAPAGQMTTAAQPSPTGQNAQTAMNPPVSNGTWTCACGQINPDTMNFCGSCGTAKPNTQNATAQPVGTPDSPWTCECGTHNTATQKFCGTCGKAKPVSTSGTTQGGTGIVYDQM